MDWRIQTSLMSVRRQASPSSLFLCRRDLFVLLSYRVAKGRKGSQRVTRALAYLQQQKQAARQSQRPTMVPVRPMEYRVTEFVRECA